MRALHVTAAAWRNGQRVWLRIRRLQVRILPWSKNLLYMNFGSILLHWQYKQLGHCMKMTLRFCVKFKTNTRKSLSYLSSRHLTLWGPFTVFTQPRVRIRVRPCCLAGQVKLAEERQHFPDAMVVEETETQPCQECNEAIAQPADDEALPRNGVFYPHILVL